MQPLAIRRWSIALVLLLCVACYKTQPPKVVAYSVPDTITVTAKARRDGKEIYIEGKTNLPDGTKLGVELLSKTDRAVAQDFNVFVKGGGSFYAGPFTNRDRPLPPGGQRVRIFTHFTPVWQSAEILDMVGAGGSKLPLSALISADPQLIDGDRQLTLTQVILLPPLENSSCACPLG